MILRRCAVGCRGLNKTPLNRMFSIQRAPMMLMEVEHCVYPNLFLFLRNFMTSLTIKNFYDRTFDRKKFADGARQALTVVSQLIGEGQFDDLGQFVRPEIVNEIRKNYESLSPTQRKQIPVDQSEIIIAYPHTIDLIHDRPTNTRLIEILMVFHVIKDVEAYREEMLQGNGTPAGNWLSAVRKMRDEIIICNYKFLRNITPNTNDDSWMIVSLNHWRPKDYY